MEQTKMCPMMFAMPADINFGDKVNPLVRDCLESSCAWWLIDRCAITALASAATDYMYPSAISVRAKDDQRAD